MTSECEDQMAEFARVTAAGLIRLNERIAAIEMTVIKQLADIRMEIARINSRIDYLGDEMTDLFDKWSKI